MFAPHTLPHTVLEMFTLSHPCLTFQLPEQHKHMRTSSNEDCRFIPKAIPISPEIAAENIPISSCRPSRSMMLRWLSRLMRITLSDWSISSRSFWISLRIFSAWVWECDEWRKSPRRRREGERGEKRWERDEGRGVDVGCWNEVLNNKGQQVVKKRGKMERGGGQRREDQRRWGYYLHEVCFQNVIKIFSIILLTIHPVEDQDMNMMSW